KETALQEAYRILRPKGVLLILEFSKPLHPLISGAYKSFQAFWPVAGNILLGNAQPYQYLIESIDKHPHQGAVKQMLEDAKFQSVTCSNFLGGIAAIHKGHKSFG
ncbi:class I SAM-dependent methyltransferase, partial [Gammaproteobacteria bacterium]|nr:class I SAM-dependent methyltransferase [Gammaproteobacteria bacterium]